MPGRDRLSPEPLRDEEQRTVAGTTSIRVPLSDLSGFAVCAHRNHAANISPRAHASSSRRSFALRYNTGTRGTVPDSSETADRQQPRNFPHLATKTNSCSTSPAPP